MLCALCLRSFTHGRCCPPPPPPKLHLWLQYVHVTQHESNYDSVWTTFQIPNHELSETSTWGPPSHLFNRHRRFFSGGVNLITHLHTVPILRTSGAIPLPPPHMPSWRGQGKPYLITAFCAPKSTFMLIFNTHFLFQDYAICIITLLCINSSLI